MERKSDLHNVKFFWQFYHTKKFDIHYLNGLVYVYHLGESVLCPFRQVLNFLFSNVQHLVERICYEICSFITLTPLLHDIFVRKGQLDILQSGQKIMNNRSHLYLCSQHI